MEVLMTFEQTVEIPANRRLTIDIPREFPASAAILTFTPKPAYPAYKTAQARLQETVEKLRNLAKDSSFSSEDLFKDRALDEAQYRRLFQKG
jgi:predicted SPOUT superfamily RNA methylase MTH1